MRNNQERFTPGQAEAPQFNFITPVELVQLPSTGRFYPPDHPLHMQKHVEIREMTAKEEDILSNKSYLEKGVALDKLISSILVNKAIDTQTILTIDKNAILLAARISAYGADYPVVMKCADCEKTSEVSVDLNNLLQIQPSNLPEGAEERGNGFVTLTLPSSKWVVEVHPMNGYSQAALEKNIEIKRKAKIQEGVVLETLRSFIYSINGYTDESSLEQALLSMPAKDSRFIRTSYPLLFPNISSTAVVTCSHCNSSVDMEVPFNMNFFWPK